MAELSQILGTLKAAREATAWFTPVDETTRQPFGDPPFRILLRSRKSDEWYEPEHAWQVKRSVSLANNGGQLVEQDAEKFLQHMIRLHVAITVRWENLTHEGEPIPCNPQTITNIYNDREIREQLFACTSTPSNFGLTGDKEPNTELESLEKKSPNGAAGDSHGETISQSVN